MSKHIIAQSQRENEGSAYNEGISNVQLCRLSHPWGNSMPVRGKKFFGFIYGDPICTVLRQKKKNKQTKKKPQIKFLNDPGLLSRESGTEVSRFLNSVSTGEISLPKETRLL